MKYKKSLAGKPFTKDPPFTRGFVEGVGYMKNLLTANPAMFFTGVIAVLSTGIMLGRYAHEQTIDEDERFQYKPRYTVKRKEDVSNPEKPCFN